MNKYITNTSYVFMRGSMVILFRLKVVDTTSGQHHENLNYHRDKENIVSGLKNMLEVWDVKN